jgi:hypothetical protein
LKSSEHIRRRVLEICEAGAKSAETTVAWRRDISEFDDQVANFCPGCGVPARLKGHMDFEETDPYTASNADIA